MTPGDPLVDEVGRHPQNEHLLAHLAERAEPARGEYRLGPWELHVHPDLCERLEEVGSTGSAGIHGCEPDPDFGDPWLRVPAWAQDLPYAAATERLAGWVRAARDAARA